jgi:hypothetical protein
MKYDDLGTPACKSQWTTAQQLCRVQIHLFIRYNEPYQSETRKTVGNLRDQLNAQLFTYIKYVAPTCFGIQNTIFRDHVMPSLTPTVSEHAIYSWFHIQCAELVISSHKTYSSLVPIDKTLKHD